jgi:threonine dehydratase
VVALADVRAAAEVLAAHLQPTPLEAAPGLGADVHLKLENTNLTHSFKIRGALNAVANLTDAERARGVVAASSGNHAGGLAYAAHLADIDAKIVMPAVTPERKVNRVTAYGATAVIVDGNYDDAEAEARRLCDAEGRRFVSAYNDPHVVAGQGTIGLEILAQLPDVARVLVCVSGGGLIAGIATAVKGLRPDVQVIGVGAEASPALYNRFHNTSLPASDETLAEALAGDIEPGCITVPITRETVDDIVLVSEAAIEDAMRWALFEAGWVVEGGGAVCIAALQTGVIPVDGKPTVALVSGGNVDRATLQQVVCSG